jgi:hypothetical protein
MGVVERAWVAPVGGELLRAMEAALAAGGARQRVA